MYSIYETFSRILRLKTNPLGVDATMKVSDAQSLITHMWFYIEYRLIVYDSKRLTGKEMTLEGQSEPGILRETIERYRKLVDEERQTR
jgi:hypothetical protein